MSYTHAVVWMDHAEALVVHLDETNHSTKHVRSPHGKEHQHHKHGAVGAGRAGVHKDYLQAVAAAVHDAPEILVVGPASAKLEFFRHVSSHDAPLAKRILGVETVDHPSEGQLIAYARKYFIAADRMRPLET